MKVYDIMETVEQTLEAVEHNCSVKDAIKVMFKKRVHAILVLDNSNNLAGIITERDIARALGEHGKNASLLPVSQIMSLDLIICEPEQTAQEALAMMGECQIRNLPVVASNGHMLGVVGIMELVQSVLS